MAAMRSNPSALRTLREHAGHTQLSLSAAAGVSQTRISRLETDSIEIRPTTAKKLADALEVSIVDIVLAEQVAS